MSHSSPDSNNRSQPLAGKVALVTGASRSIGASIAKRLAADGARVAITYLSSADKAREVVSAIDAAGGRALAIQADAGDPAAVRAAVNETFKVFGDISILVNNAGISLGGPIEEITFADYERILAINVTGVFVATQESVRFMKPGSRIIHIGSCMTRYVPIVGGTLYTLTKSAIAGFSRALARDLGPKGITVNIVHPGPTDTDMNPDGGPLSEMIRSATALGRYGCPEEIASVVAFLARAESSFVSGAEIIADGGFTA